MFALKALSHASVPGALAKAEHYRLLNEPAEAESICRDVLGVEPDNQRALVCFVLAQSDQIPLDSRAFQNALAAAARLQGDYERAYYSGIVWERRAKAVHEEAGRGSHHTVYEWIVKALECFAAAERMEYLRAVSCETSESCAAQRRGAGADSFGIGFSFSPG